MTIFQKVKKIANLRYREHKRVVKLEAQLAELKTGDARGTRELRAGLEGEIVVLRQRLSEIKKNSSDTEAALWAEQSKREELAARNQRLDKALSDALSSAQKFSQEKEEVIKCIIKALALPQVMEMHAKGEGVDHDVVVARYCEPRKKQRPR